MSARLASLSLPAPVSRATRSPASGCRVDLLKADDDASLRAQVAEEEGEQIGEATLAIADRLRRGGKLLLFGNGGSATDANDWAIDCVSPPAGYEPVPAISLAMEPANVTAIANDVGVEVVFVRQLIAHAAPDDVAIAISTSGGSRNIIAALEEARRRRLLTVALLGYDGGEIRRRGLADHYVVVRSDFIPRIGGRRRFLDDRESLEGLRRGQV
jgi:D-sedoheptulose 7-phosphate isomerase